MKIIILDGNGDTIQLTDALKELNLCHLCVIAYVGTNSTNEDEFNRIFILGGGISSIPQDQAQFHTIGRPHVATFYCESNDCTVSSEYKCISAAIEHGRNVMLFNDIAELTKYAKAKKWRW